MEFKKFRWKILEGIIGFGYDLKENKPLYKLRYILVLFLQHLFGNYS